MSFFITTAKIIATIFLFAFFVTGIMKANRRFHSTRYPPMAEYATSFIISFLSIVGFYYLWWS